MPHIHTQPDQHDMTVSAWILRKENEEWKCLVHFHKKMDVLMQIGGHIELNETPWQSLAHELNEEAGYDLSQLNILQFTGEKIKTTRNVQHPVPFVLNTHDVGNQHFHTDLCYGFIAQELPASAPKKDESLDLRWLSLGELRTALSDGETLEDIVYTYEQLVSMQKKMVELSAGGFSIAKPLHTTVTYKRGAVDR